MKLDRPSRHLSSGQTEAGRTPTGPGNIRPLTGIREIAALGVMAFHYWDVNWVPIDTISGNACARGYICVDLFFILSGFVMAKAYGGRFMADFGPSDYARFIGVRLARVYPVYVVLLAAAIGIAWVHPRYSAEITTAAVFANAALVQTWLGRESIIGTAWSLSTEWAAYLTFPALVWLLLRQRASVTRLACLGAASLLVLLWTYQVSQGIPVPYALNDTSGILVPMLRCFVGFTLGMGVFRLANWPGMRAAGSDRFGAAVVLILATLWLMRGTPDLLIYACLPFLILCLALNGRWLAAMFGNRPVFLLGEWSYSIYLVHIFFIRGRERTFNALVKYMPSTLADTLDSVAFFGLAIGVSAACFSLLEVPARRRLRSLIEARRRPIELEPSAP